MKQALKRSGKTRCVISGKHFNSVRRQVDRQIKKGYMISSSTTNDAGIKVVLVKEVN